MANLDENEFKWHTFTEVWVVTGLHRGDPVRYEYTNYNEFDPEAKAWSMFHTLKASEDFDWLNIFMHLEKRSEEKLVVSYIRNSSIAVNIDVKKEESVPK